MQLVYNKKLGLNYEIKEKIAVGIELLGFEVKSLRKKQGSLDGARAIIRGGEVFLIGSYIPPYQESNTPKNYDPHRNRKLLLNKNEIEKLQTLPEGYTNILSKTEAHKVIGNGWTLEVIKHIFKNIKCHYKYLIQNYLKYLKKKQ